MKIKKIDQDHIEIDFKATNTRVLAICNKALSYEVRAIECLGEVYIDQRYLLTMPSIVRTWLGPSLPKARYSSNAKIKKFMQDWCIELFCQKLKILNLIGLVKNCRKQGN
jgi:hypothetical protein